MPVLTLESPAPLVAIVHVDGQTVRDVGVTDLGDGLVAIDLGGVQVGARQIGRHPPRPHRGRRHDPRPTAGHPMTARADNCVYLDEVPLVRVHESTNTNGRAILAIDSVLTILGPVEVMRATLVAALPEGDR